MSEAVVKTRAPRDDVRLPRVSVVVPSYNYGMFIEGCLRSALGQQDVDLDVLVIDDASTDDTVARVRAIASRDPRVKLVVHGANRGHIATFNEALMGATGDYVVKLDADDLLAPGALARAASVLAADQSVGFVYGRPTTFSDDVPGLEREHTRSVSVWSGDRWLARICRRGANVIMQPEVMIRCTTLHACGAHMDAVPEASDFHLWMRMAARSNVARINGSAQGYYRVHAGSMQHTIHSGRLSNLNGREKAFRLFFEAEGAKLANRKDLQMSVRRALAREALQLYREALRTNPPDPAAREYLEFAHRSDPDLMGLARWSRYERGTALALQPVVRSTLAMTDDIRSRVRWRRWQMTGL